jgi:hypothetical protein
MTAQPETIQWALDGIDAGTEEAWREQLVWEAARRAAEPHRLRVLARLYQRDDPEFARWTMEAVHYAVHEAIRVAFALSEALRDMEATPQADDQPGREARLGQAIARAVELMELSREDREALTDLGGVARVQRAFDNLARAMLAGTRSRGEYREGRAA